MGEASERRGNPGLLGPEKRSEEKSTYERKELKLKNADNTWCRRLSSAVVMGTREFEFGFEFEFKSSARKRRWDGRAQAAGWQREDLRMWTRPRHQLSRLAESATPVSARDSVAPGPRTGRRVSDRTHQSFFITSTQYVLPTAGCRGKRWPPSLHVLCRHRHSQAYALERRRHPEG